MVDHQQSIVNSIFLVILVAISIVIYVTVGQSNDKQMAVGKFEDRLLSRQEMTERSATTKSTTTETTTTTTTPKTPFIFDYSPYNPNNTILIELLQVVNTYPRIASQREKLLLNDTFRHKLNGLHSGDKNKIREQIFLHELDDNNIHPNNGSLKDYWQQNYWAFGVFFYRNFYFDD